MYATINIKSKIKYNLLHNYCIAHNGKGSKTQTMYKLLNGESMGVTEFVPI
jgi:hypothetical protein